MTVPWMPLLGAVFFHLMSLLTDQPRLITLTRRVIRPYYLPVNPVLVDGPD